MWPGHETTHEQPYDVDPHCTGTFENLLDCAAEGSWKGFGARTKAARTASDLGFWSSFAGSQRSLPHSLGKGVSEKCGHQRVDFASYLIDG
jgi:hypothetical protein